MDVLFISTHRIGFKEPLLTQGKSGEVAVHERLTADEMVSAIERCTAQDKMIVAYLPATEGRLVEDLASLARCYPTSLRFVSCECAVGYKHAMFGDQGLRINDMTYWTKACGGTKPMADIAHYVRDHGQLPPLDFLQQ